MLEACSTTRRTWACGDLLAGALVFVNTCAKRRDMYYDE